MEYLYKPAFYAHMLSSIAMIAALILLAVNHKKLFKMDGIELVKIFSVLAIAIAAHGQAHTTLEKEYGYDLVNIFTMKYHM
jgi:K+-sensing histidine kinase KdpD